MDNTALLEVVEILAAAGFLPHGPPENLRGHDRPVQPRRADRPGHARPTA
ncbi:MAG: hypothetical protein MZV70_18835 [Desulfobacterales bacterium]|nr:hypothetical protein [Desulfobacterales bacterium]